MTTVNTVQNEAGNQIGLNPNELHGKSHISRDVNVCYTFYKQHDSNLIQVIASKTLNQHKEGETHHVLSIDCNSYTQLSEKLKGRQN